MFPVSYTHLDVYKRQLQEGIVWEAAMQAAHRKLDNLVAIVDLNGLQIDGKVSDVKCVCPVAVSYTHLDVYKRQEVSSSVSNHFLSPIHSDVVLHCAR